ncbi:hypothetical protein BVRB_5g126390 [Beta vulgaris subsp. vulgaris]|uniref:Uncharacterized protein n=1 Tax=Beta vulgaris subsp. vulgaris TaxID=3555 RepID=A0A0J8B992_BETVV|nr:hypothetical protein BVRB_5g126390 [Beta vulgaris subsp. vulgaris]
MDRSGWSPPLMNLGGTSSSTGTPHPLLEPLFDEILIGGIPVVSAAFECLDPTQVLDALPYSSDVCKMMDVQPSLVLWRNMMKLVTMSAAPNGEGWWSFQVKHPYKVVGAMPMNRQFFHTEFMYVYRAEQWNLPVLPLLEGPNVWLKRTIPRMSEDEAMVAIYSQCLTILERGDKKQVPHFWNPAADDLSNEHFLSAMGLSPTYPQVIARQELNEEMHKRLTANQRVQEQLKMKLSKGDNKVPRAPKDPSKMPKVRPPTKSAIVTPQGEVERRELATKDTPRPPRDTSKSKGKAVEIRGMEDVSLVREEEFPLSKKRKAVESEDDTRDFTQKSTLEKAFLFDSVVKRFISKADLKLIRNLTEEEEVEQLHLSYIDHSIRMAVMSHRHTTGFRKLRAGLKEKTKLAEERAKEIEELNKGFEEERALWATEKAALEQRIKDLTRQRNCVLHQRDEIIEECKTSKAGLEFAADMGLEASDVAAREAWIGSRVPSGRCIPKRAGLQSRRNTISLLRQLSAKVVRPTPRSRWTIPQQVENPLASGGPIAEDEVVLESSSDRVASSDNSLDSDNIEAVSETSESESSSSST